MTRLGRWHARWVSALVSVVALSAGGVCAGSSAWADSVPYVDHNALGTMGICDAKGNEVRAGEVAAVPFAWKIVSSYRPPVPYDGDGRAAVLGAYQPRQGLSPGEWSGEFLTAASYYSNPQYPMAAGTRGDVSLGSFVQDFPTRWDGLVQLRTYYKAPNEPTFTRTYAAADIKVDGDRWRLVRGGGLPCTAGTARSIASILVPQVAAGKFNPGAPTPEPAPGTTAAGGAASQGKSGAAAKTTSHPSATPVVGSSAASAAKTGRGASSSGGFPAWGWGLVGLAVLALAGLTALLLRRRRSAA